MRFPAQSLLLAVLAAGLAALFIPHRQADPLGRTSAQAVDAVPVAAMGPIRFADAAVSAGLGYRWTIPGTRPLNILQTIGNGCAFLDYDNDGSLDVLLVGTDRVALYRGDGHGHFTDVTHPMGLDVLRGHFLGCAVGDYDNDGYDDLYVSGYQTGVLLHNEHGRRFTDVTRRMGLAPQRWGTSAAWAEAVTGSGRLDLYVCNYVQFGPASVQLCKMSSGPEHTELSACSPELYPGIRGVLYRNLGASGFQDVTHACGADTHSGKGLGAAWADFDGSGRVSLAVENDTAPGDLFLNTGAGRLRNIGIASGTAFGPEGAGQPHGGMGMDWGDYDGDGRLDLFVATFYEQEKCLYHNDGRDVFSERGRAAGMGGVTAYRSTAFGCKFLDASNTGRLDLLIASGHVQDNVDRFNYYDHSNYRQATLFFHNSGHGLAPYQDLSRNVGPDLVRPIVGRGLAVGDYDNDGREDALVVDSEGAPLLLHNESAPTGHWLGLRLVGTRSNRDGYGAMLTAKVGGRTLLRHCHADGSYLSSSDKRVHFGLGAATRVDTLTVRWPAGTVDTLRNVSGDRYLTLTEGRGGGYRTERSERSGAR